MRTNGTNGFGNAAWIAVLAFALVFGAWATGLASVSTVSLNSFNLEKMDDRIGAAVHQDISENVRAFLPGADS